MRTLFFIILLFTGADSFAQSQADTTLKPDSIVVPRAVQQVNSEAYRISESNNFLNLSAKPIAISSGLEKHSSKTDNFLFFYLTGLALFFGLLRILFDRYFVTMFRVLFNTSLRQSFLTDQLVQGSLPSLLFNILFAFSAGAFLYLVLLRSNWLSGHQQLRALAAVTLLITIIYLSKYFGLLLLGWITGLQKELKVYNFNVFLVNKILGILLIPLLFIMAFAFPALSTAGYVLSLTLVIFMLAIRSYRSFSRIQFNQEINKFQFLLYVVCMEVIPLLLLLKVSRDYFS